MQKNIRYILIILAMLIVATSSNAQTGEKQQQVQPDTSSSVFFLRKLIENENTIRQSRDKIITVFYVGSMTNRLTVIKKDFNYLEQRKFAYVLSVVSYRLAILAQNSDMPSAVVACHIAEAKSLENISKGGVPAPANCRSNAYGPNIEVDLMHEFVKPTWAATSALATDWAINVFSYAEAIGKTSNYGMPPSN